MTEKLPDLLSVSMICKETKLKRAGAEALMRQLPKVRIEGHKAAYVKRCDLERYLEEHTEHVVARRGMRAA
jgi:hypothetical protein